MSIEYETKQKNNTGHPENLKYPLLSLIRKKCRNLNKEEHAMGIANVSLEDKFDILKHQVLLNGTQALVRLMIAQKARDKKNGWNTAGYVTGYRGSPLGAVDFQMRRAKKELKKASVNFQEGLNEDLAVTAIWGSQQAELRGEGKFDGVFGLWYGKGPGVDRSGDAMRHANMAGSSAKGGVIMAMGDDHTGESSTTLHQSDFAMIDANLPIVSPAGVQEILDYGHYAFELSRFSGLWVGLKTMKDTIEVTSVVDSNPERMSFTVPDFVLPDGGLNIRLVDTPQAMEARLLDYKISAAEAFARVNRIDKRVLGKKGAKIGIIAAGKNWLDVVHSMSLLNVCEEEANKLGITTYKLAQTWPIDKMSFLEWAEDLELIVVVEEKRKLIEGQVKEALFDDLKERRVFGKTKGDAKKPLFHSKSALDASYIAEQLGKIFVDEGCSNELVESGLKYLSQARRADNASDIATRTPYFCAGCPHNSSTKVPKGSRAYAGIGCHFMAQWMDRETLGYTHMGGEGANWIGESLFSDRNHVFQNLGDGTYNHSGIQAVRAAIAADTNITYKILFNDAVAMTGGQSNDGGLSAPRIANELLAMGIKRLELVYDDKEQLDLSVFPKKIGKHHRDDLIEVQKELAGIKGVSAIIYVQTCAAEKRRRRKRGQFPDPDQRIFINSDVCEGCGDCGIQSNCVALTPVDTLFGRKRAIDQSSCNKDFSCIKGFCPSFVTLHGATPKKRKVRHFDVPNMPIPKIKPIQGTHNLVITGVGGAGVVTIGAILAQAAHIDGKGAGMMEMAGLAQKGGAVHIHCRLAETPGQISAIRVGIGECDALIGGDLVVSSGSKTLGLTSEGRTGAVVNSHEIVTGEFTRDTEFKIPQDQLLLNMEARLKDDLLLFDFSLLSKELMGDSIFANMMVFGAAWQQGLVPVSKDAIQKAINLNQASVEKNQRAFQLGRWAAFAPQKAAEILSTNSMLLPRSLKDKISYFEEHLILFQGRRLAKKFRSLIDPIKEDRVKEAVARGYHKLLAYKDEYEVARLHLETRHKAEENFDGVDLITYHLAPPLLSKIGSEGRPIKRQFGSLMERIFPILASLKILRGTALDIFGYTAERKRERAWIRQYESDMAEILPKLNNETEDLIVALAELPIAIRGFGPVKSANEQKAGKKRKEILYALKNPRSGLTRAAE